MHRAATFVLYLVLVLAALSPAYGAAQSLDDYRSSIERARADLAAGDVDAAEQSLGAIQPITLGDGTTVEPDLTAVLDALDDRPPDVELARQHLDAILAALDNAASAGVEPGDDADALLDDVLAREEFSPDAREEPEPSLWERFWSWLWSTLPGIDPATGGDGAGWQLLNLLMAVAAVLMVAGLIFWVWRTFRRQLAPPVVGVDSNAISEERMTSAQARAEAERLVGQGQFRAALRLLYLATLIRWEEAGRLRFDRSLTNREVLRQAAAQGDAALIERLTPLVERFDRVWYGDLDCSAEDFRSFARLADRSWEPSA